MVTADHVCGVVGGDIVFIMVLHPCQMRYIPHIKLIKQWDSISIHVSSFLGHYTTDGGKWFYLLIPKKPG